MRHPLHQFGVKSCPPPLIPKIRQERDNSIEVVA
jgi:hypothetical protein